jgi:hypothetical protein
MRTLSFLNRVGKALGFRAHDDMAEHKLYTWPAQDGLDGYVLSTDGAGNLSFVEAGDHAHIIADISGLQAALDGKASSAHAHIIGDVTGLQAALDSKAASSHNHDDRYYTDVETDSLLNNKASIGSVTTSGLTIATQRLAGRTSLGTGALEEISAGDGILLASGSIKSLSSAAVSMSSANTNNVANGGGAVVNFRCTASADTYALTGITAPSYDGQIAIVRNSGSNPFRISGEDTNSTAANRFALPLPFPWVVARPGDCYVFRYDLTDARWNYVSGMEGWLKDGNYLVSDLLETFQGGTAAGSGTTGELGWTQGGTGSSGIASVETDAWGVRYLRTAAVNAERSLVLGSAFGTPFSGLFGSDSLLIGGARVKLSTAIPDATNNFYFAFGFGDLNTGSGISPFRFRDGCSGFVFEANRVLSTTNWYTSCSDDAVNFSGGDTGVALATSYVNLMYMYDRVNSVLKAYINGTLTNTISTNLPGSSFEQNIALFYTVRVAGTATRDINIDTWYGRHFRRRRV